MHVHRGRRKWTVTSSGRMRVVERCSTLGCDEFRVAYEGLPWTPWTDERKQKEAA